MVRPVLYELGEIQADQKKEGRETNTKKFRQLLKQSFIQVIRARTWDTHRRYNERNEVEQMGTSDDTTQVDQKKKKMGSPQNRCLIAIRTPLPVDFCDSVRSLSQLKME